MSNESGKDTGVEKTTPVGASSVTNPWMAAFLWELLGLGIVLGILVVVIVVGISLISGKREAVEQKRKAASAGRVEEPVSVAVMEIAPETVVDRIRLPGLVSAWEDIALSAQVAGRVVEILVGDGQPVKKGQVLLKLESSDYEIRLADARAALLLAEQTYNRTQTLHRKKVASSDQLDRDRSAFIRARAAVDTMQLALDRCAIRSPLTGMVNDILPERGELIGISDRVAVVLDISKVKVDVGIPEKDIDAVRSLTECDIFIDSVGDGITVKGKKIYLSYKPIKEALLYNLRLEVANDKLLLRPGMFVAADIVKERRPNSVRVPLYTVLPRGDGYIAYVAEKKGEGWVAHERKVEIGLIQGKNVEVRKGLSLGEKLIVLGQRSVAEATPVKVVKTLRDIQEIAR